MLAVHDSIHLAASISEYWKANSTLATPGLLIAYTGFACDVHSQLFQEYNQ
jgi:hypothetical protein